MTNHQDKREAIVELIQLSDDINTLINQEGDIYSHINTMMHLTLANGNAIVVDEYVRAYRAIDPIELELMEKQSRKSDLIAIIKGA